MKVFCLICDMVLCKEVTGDDNNVYAGLMHWKRQTLNCIMLYGHNLFSVKAAVWMYVSLVYIPSAFIGVYQWWIVSLNRYKFRNIQKRFNA